MKNSQNKKKLQIVLVVLIAVLALGIGYAGITAINLAINGTGTASVSQDNFKVYFTTSDITTGTGTASINENDNTVAYFNISGLSKVGDKAIATYTVLNDSNGLGAEFSLNLTNTNTEFFKVTEKIINNKLRVGESTVVYVIVELIKTPIGNNETTSITAKLTSSPIENFSEAGGDSSYVIVPYNYIYTFNDYNKQLVVNRSIPSSVVQYNDFSAAASAYGHPVSIASITSNGVIVELYVAFEKNGQIYYLRGGFEETNLDEKPIYDENIRIMKEAFGEENWDTMCRPFSEYGYECDDGNILVIVYYYGVSARASDTSDRNSWYCVANGSTSYPKAYASCR